MKNRLLSDAEVEQILGGCDEKAKEYVNYAEKIHCAAMSDCTKRRPIIQSDAERPMFSCYSTWSVYTPQCKTILY